MHRIVKHFIFSTSALVLVSPQLVAQDGTVSVPETAASVAVPPVPEKPPGWETSIALNLGLNGGNSESLNVRGDFLTKREFGQHQIQIGADAAYSDATTKSVENGQLIETDTTNVNNYGGFLQYNYLITDRWYAGARLEGRHDDIAGVNYRIATTANVGYYLIKKDQMFLTAEAGPGYIWEELDGSGKNDYATIRFAENFEWKFAEKTRLFQSFEYLPEIADFGNFLMNAVVGIETDIAKGLALQVVFRNFYRSNPAEWAGTDPVVFRDKNDYQLLAGVIYRFQ